ncbi:MAG: transcription elongation factor GreAB, partial [Bdellovibrionota bacterium]
MGDSKMNKSSLQRAMIDHLETEITNLNVAARAAHEAATHAESKAEDQYDTRGLEASYLAGAQAKRVGELEQALAAMRAIEPRSWSKNQPIAIGALVELKAAEDAKLTYYFLAAFGGGLTIQHEGKSIQVLTPQSPVGAALIGELSGTKVEVEIRAGVSR